MNKKIILTLSLILVTTLSSCNKNKFTRDSYKEVTQDEFISRLNSIKTNATPANLNKKGKVSFTNKIKHYSKINNLLYWDVNYTRNYSYEWSEDDNYLKFKYDIAGRYDYDEGEYYIIDAKESFTYYIKKIDNNYFLFTQDDIVGTKYKKKFETSISSIREELKQLLGNDAYLAVSPMYYDVCETTAGESSLALSNGYMMPSIFGENNLYLLYGNKEKYKKIDDNKGDAKAKFGSNDEKSISYNLNGTINVQNYLKMMLEDEAIAKIKNPSGNVNLDLYFSFKDNFFSQCESTNKYDITYEMDLNNETRKHNCINDCYFNLQSRLGECNIDTINADQYIEIKVN